MWVLFPDMNNQYLKTRLIDVSHFFSFEIDWISGQYALLGKAIGASREPLLEETPRTHGANPVFIPIAYQAIIEGLREGVEFLDLSDLFEKPIS